MAKNLQWFKYPLYIESVSIDSIKNDKKVSELLKNLENSLVKKSRNTGTTIKR